MVVKSCKKYTIRYPFNGTEDLGSCDRASWAKYEDRKTNKMQQLDVYY